MDRQPVLEGERLVLRPLRDSDWDAFCVAACDPLIWEQHPVGERGEPGPCRAWFDYLIEDGGSLAVIERLNDKLVGHSRFELMDEFPASAIIGSTFLVRKEWGGATNREMKRLMIAHALAAEPRAVFLIGDTNWRSRRAMEKIGGRLTGETFLAPYPGGDILHLVYEIRREDFAKGPLSA